MRKVLLIALLALTLLVAACATPTPTVAPTVAPTKVPAASAPAVTSAPAASSVPVATSAPAATAAPVASSAPAATSAPTTASAGTPKTGGTLKILVPQMPASLNVTDITWTGGSNPYILPAVETLVGMTQDGPAPTKLATSWDIAPDGKSITFKLRQGVKFHDGADFNAQAVKWNLEKIRPHRDELKVIASIDVVDPNTVKLNLSEYSGALLDQFTQADGLMVSPASIEGREATYTASHLIGTGPFELVSYQRDTNAVYKKFANYWDKGKPYLDGIEYIVVKDENTSRSALLSGQAQVWDYVTPKNIADLKAQGYAINSYPGGARVGIPDSANANSPFAKKPVREALEYAVDKKALVDTFGAGTWEVPAAPCPSRQIGCSAVTQGRSYDPAQAKQLLAQAGYPNGFKTVIYAPASVDPVLLTALQGYFKAVGIDAEIQVLDSAKIATIRTKGWNNGILVQAVGSPTPSFIVSMQLDGPTPNRSYSALASPEYTALLKKADATTDAAAREALTEQLVKLVQDEAVIIPFAIESGNTAYQKNVHIDRNNLPNFWNPGDAWIGQ